MTDEESREMRITPLTVMEIQKLFDYLVKNDTYMAVMGNLNIQYKGTVEDTSRRKREIFYIERKLQ